MATTVQDSIRARREHPAKFRPTPDKGAVAPVIKAGMVENTAASNAATTLPATDGWTTPVAVPAAPVNEAVAVQQPTPVIQPQPVTQPAPVVPAGNLFGGNGTVETKIPTGPTREEIRAELEVQHAQELQALRKELSERDAQLQELQVLKQKQERLELEKMLSLEGVEFESMDPALAQEFKAKVGIPIVQQVLKVTEQRDAEFRKMLEQQALVQKQHEEAVREADSRRALGAINAAIAAVHPDASTLLPSAEFQNYILTTPVSPGSSLMLDSVIRREYNAGNASYVIDRISEFKRGRPNLGSIASVGSVGVATTPESVVPEALSNEDLAAKRRELAAAYVRKDVSRAELADARKKLLRGKA